MKNTQKPIIGIVPLWDEEKESYWMLPGYMKGIEQADGIPVMLPLSSDEFVLEQLTNVCDGFLFTGGQDVSPSVYQEKETAKCGECCAERDEMEKTLFSMATKKDKSILGICRGIQFINAMTGGTLYQDLPSEHPSDVCHHQSPPYDKPVHHVTIVENSPLYDLLQKKDLPVNSYHHQAVKKLSPMLQPMAYSEDGLVEAVCLPDAHFVWAVQWHPEFAYLTDEDSKKILEHFVQSCI